MSDVISDDVHGDDRDPFDRGVVLFNAGQWFDAHEAWEDLWHMATGRHRETLQGLIQLAVTMEHMRRGNPRGVINVFDASTRHLAGAPELFMGIELARLQREVGELVRQVRAMPEACLRPGAPRGQVLPVDLAKPPRIVRADAR